jgi:ATP-dependent DNA helicase RecG
MASRVAPKSSRIEGILNNLMVSPAAELESQTLECKGWGKDEKDLSRLIGEATVCLANAEGGLVLIGVHDRKVGRAAFEACRFGSIRADWVRSRIGQATKPPVRCSVAMAREAVPNLPCPESGDVIVIEVFKRTNPSGHMTSDGISYVRVDKECRQTRRRPRKRCSPPPNEAVTRH